MNVGYPELSWGGEFILELEGHLTPLQRDQLDSRRYAFIMGIQERINQIKEKKQKDAEKAAKATQGKTRRIRRPIFRRRK